MDLLFSSLSIKRLGYLILVALSVYAITYVCTNREAYWLVWSAFLLSLITTGNSFGRRVSIILITGLLAAFLSFMVGNLVDQPLFLTIILFLIFLFSVSFGVRRPAYFFEVSIILSFVILSGYKSYSLMTNLDKFGFICGGMLIAAGLQIVFYPYFVRNELNAYIIISLRRLRSLNGEIFSCFLEPESTENIYPHERRLHEYKDAFLRAFARLREIIAVAAINCSDAERDSHVLWLTELDNIFVNMLDYAQLRRRVTDITTFTVCKDEMLNLAKATDACFVAVMAGVKRKKHLLSIELLTQAVSQLEINFHQVLQVAAPEPLVFLLFIDSLHAFNRKMEVLLGRLGVSESAEFATAENKEAL